MSGSGSWTSDETGLVADRFRSWAQSQPVPIDQWKFLETFPTHRDRLPDAIGRLMAEGVTKRVDASLGGDDPYLVLTPEAKAEESHRSTSRESPRQRGVACREALLDWFYDQKYDPNPTDFLGDARAHVYGDPFTKDEVEDAADKLSEGGLISGPLRARITAEGRAVIDHHGGQLSGQSVLAGAAAVTNHNTFNAPVGQFAQGHSFTQVQKVGLDPVELSAAIKAVRQELDQLEPTDREKARRALEGIEDEAEDGLPSADAVTRRASRLKEVAEKAGIATLSTAVGHLIDYLQGGIGG